MKHTTRIKLVGILATFLIVLGVVLGIVYSKSNLQNKKSTSNQAIEETSSKLTKKASGTTLIIYFSHSGANYEGYRKVGNTQVIANYIKSKTNADIYRLIPAKAYPNKSLSKLEDIATEEKDNNARPSIKGTLPNVDNYENIFIGSPIWYSEYPMIMRTLFDKVDLNNKTIIPFVTDGGSGFGSTQEILRDQYPKATILKGFQVQGADVQDAQNDVNQWLTKLGY